MAVDQVADSFQSRLGRETALGHLVRRIPTAAPTDTARDVLRAITGRSFESAAHVAVLDSSRLVGLVGIEQLLAASGAEAMSVLMDPDPPIVAPGADQEVAAWKATRHGEASLAVVDNDGRFVGLIPAPRLLNVLLAEHDEDMAHLGGFLRGSNQARMASEERLSRRLWHRLPWLGIGLAGAIGSAKLVGGFEQMLQEQISLAFFMPGVVYLADAVGTQTETVVVRGLSVGVPIRGMARNEAFTGLLAGLILAACFFPVGILMWGGGPIAVSVAVALFVACVIATVIGLVLPWLLQVMGWDPAFGTGPLSTVLQDFFSIAAYLGVAMLLTT